MQTTRSHTQKHHYEVLFVRLTLAILLGLLLALSASLLFLTGYQLTHLGSIYRGVRVSGTDVSGLTVQEAAQAILETVTYPQSGHILLSDGERQWLASPAELGLILDAGRSAELAFQVGRSGNIGQRLWSQYNASSYGIDIVPVFTLNLDSAYQFLNAIASQIYVPVIEPNLRIDGDQVIVQQGQKGRSLNAAATLDLITIQIHTLQDGIVPLVIEEQSPIIVDVSQQAELAQRILSQPLTLSLPEGEINGLGPWAFEPLVLASMLSFEHVQSGDQMGYQVTLDDQLLYNFLIGLEPVIYRSPQNARFIFNDDTHLLEVLEPSITGRSLDIDASIQSIQTKLIEGEHNVGLELVHTPPPATDSMTGAELGVTELIHAETSYFYGSSADRVQNISAAASRFHGLLVAPWETFSMAAALGDISLENGYAEALIIYGGQTIQGVGGGVCQVSTTLFRAAFFAGFPIVERHSHAYRVSYYEKIAGNIRDNSLAGLDATVFVPLVDFKFTNNSPHWLLMETYVNPSYNSIMWKFYSTSDGRSVDWDTTGVTNVVEAPKTLYRENPELPQGEVKQIDWKADGADVTVNRRVYRDGVIIIEDTFKTHYQPWQAIYEYGPGTEGMPPPEDKEEVN